MLPHKVLSALDDDNVNAVAASTTTAGAAVATVVELDLSQQTIPTRSRSPMVLEQQLLMRQLIADNRRCRHGGCYQLWLEQAGMDASITVAEAAGTITLTQAAGREISVSEFQLRWRWINAGRCWCGYQWWRELPERWIWVRMLQRFQVFPSRLLQRHLMRSRNN